MRRPRRELFRLPIEGKIAGVCAGIAECFGLETWLVRILFISGVLWSGASGGSLFIFGYIALWFILDVRPGSEKSSKQKKHHKGRHQQWDDRYNEEVDSEIRSRFESKRPIEVKEKVWQAGEPPRQAFHDINEQFQDLEKRLQNLETYVTSTEFTVANEINRL